MALSRCLELKSKAQTVSLVVLVAVACGTIQVLVQTAIPAEPCKFLSKLSSDLEAPLPALSSFVSARADGWCYHPAPTLNLLDDAMESLGPIVHCATPLVVGRRSLFHLGSQLVQLKTALYSVSKQAIQNRDVLIDTTLQMQKAANDCADKATTLAVDLLLFLQRMLSSIQKKMLPFTQSQIRSINLHERAAVLEELNTQTRILEKLIDTTDSVIVANKNLQSLNEHFGAEMGSAKASNNGWVASYFGSAEYAVVKKGLSLHEDIATTTRQLREDLKGYMANIQNLAGSHGFAVAQNMRTLQITCVNPVSNVPVLCTVAEKALQIQANATRFLSILPAFPP